MSALSDLLGASQYGAAMVYHELLAVVPAVHEWTTEHPQAVELIDKGAGLAQEVLVTTGAPGAVTAGLVLGFLRQLAARDGTVQSRSPA